MINVILGIPENVSKFEYAVCMGFVYNQSAEGIGTVMRITVASGVILILLSLAERTAPGLLEIGCLEAKSAPICMMLAPVL